MKKILLSFAIALCVLTGCSREDDIHVNGTLKNNHSVVFAFTSAPGDVQAFVDSISELDSVYTYDTLTVTVHDSLHFIGFLKYNNEKIIRYAWNMGDKDTLLSGANAALQGYAFDSAGIYSPLFIAVDGAAARDTAGKGQYIRVINTPPIIKTEMDTLWVKAASNATVEFFASDSFGTIDSVYSLLLNSSGKSSKKLFRATAITSIDSSIHDEYSTTVIYDSAKALLDTLNNVKLVLGAIDEDKNETTDTIILHFNKVPTIELVSPDSASRVSKYASRFAFYYKSTDGDNPNDLRYTIRLGKSPDNAGTAPILTDANAVATNIKEKSWEAISDSVWNIPESMTGNLYWQVAVTDGYDTVESKTWKFFFGDLSTTEGTFYGYAKYEGKTLFNGIRVVLQNLATGNFTYTHTSSKGYYTAAVEPGYYKIYAQDTSGLGYKHVEIDSQYVEMGDERMVANLILEDSIAPKIKVNALADTLTSRAFSLSGALSDSGSQVKSAEAVLDGSPVSLSTLKVNEWILNLENATDGLHTFSMTVADSAGNVSDTLKLSFVVKAAAMSFTVNGQTTSMVNTTESLNFAAAIINAYPMPTSIIWTSTIEGTAFKDTTAIGSDSTATLTLSKTDLATAINGTLYTMTATSLDGSMKATVRFGFIGDDPIIYFLTPTADTTISINDPLSFTLSSMKGNATSATIKWSCDKTLSNGYTCPTEGSDSTTTLAWASIGTKTITATITNDNDKQATDEIKINIVSDPPKLTISASADTIRQKINANVSFQIAASDKYGTVDSIKWGCSNGNVLSYDSSRIFTGSKSVSATLGATLPGEATNSYKCVVKAIDDDNESSLDTLFFRVVLDEPTVTLNTTQATLKINATTDLSASAYDTLGYIAAYYMYCSTDLSDSDYVKISKADTTIKMPSTACTWKCVIKVVDDDGLVAKDTGTYTVLLDPPTVTVSEDTLTKTIKDTVILDAIASDALGKIALYEWSCGSEGSAGNTYVSSATTPRYTAIMPSDARTNYLCIIRVTDDDGNTTKDTTHISVLLDPPTVTVASETLTSRAGVKIALDATAKDGMGYIAKREWSCGAPSEISSNWKKVSDYDTTWTSPTSTPATYYCVARATDDDGNIAQDTMEISFSSKTPVITVDNDIVYVRQGKTSDLTASINDAWQGVKKYTWTCGISGSSSLNDTSTWYNYDSSFPYAGSSFSMLSTAGKDFICIVWAEESGTDFIGKDTTSVKILTTLPIGVISLPDTAYIWSTDSSVTNQAKYYYTTDINGSSSTIGTLGNANAEEFWWNFSNINSNYWYEGNSDGSIDTSIAEFNTAFLRLTGKGSITIKLDFRDSTTEETDGTFLAGFYDRHRADVVKKTIYFQKAWENISGGTDSVIESSTNTNAPALIYCNGRLITAYINESGSLVTKYLNGKTWTSFGSPSVTNVLSPTLNFVNNADTALYLYYIDTDNVGHVLRSASGTGTWAQLGSNIGESLSSFKLKVNPSTGLPSVATVGYYNSTANTPRISDYTGSDWGTVFNPAYSSSWQAREIDMAFDADGNRLAIITGHSTNDYNIYYTYFTSGSTTTSTTGSYGVGINGESVQLFYSNGYFYVGFRSRDDGALPRMVRAPNTASKLKASGAFTTSGTEFAAFGHMCYNSFFTFDANGNPIVAVDDSYYAKNAQVHIYRYNSGWHELGENELPYFKTLFVKANKYYIRGYKPQLAVSSSGGIYVSMRAQEAASAAGSALPGAANGPLIMHFLGDNW